MAYDATTKALSNRAKATAEGTKATAEGIKAISNRATKASSSRTTKASSNGATKAASNAADVTAQLAAGANNGPHEVCRAGMSPAFPPNCWHEMSSTSGYCHRFR